MPSFGINPEGFFRKTREDILNDINGDQLNTISATLNHSSSSVLGQLNNIVADHKAEIWEVLEAVFNAIDPATATGLALDYLALQQGLTRIPATLTTGNVEFIINAPVTIPIGTVLSLASDPDAKFTTIVTIVAASPGTYATVVAATETGPIIAIAGDVSVLDNPIGQVDSVSNPLDLSTGNDLESDEDFRSRYFQAQAFTGKATKPAITSALLRTDGVAEALVFNNRNDSPNAEGVPGHSIEAVVDGGTDNAIAQTLYDTVAAHGGFYSSTGDSGIATDEITAETFVIEFSRPGLIDMGFELDIRITPSIFPSDGDLQIRETLKTYIDALGLGNDVILSQLNCPLFTIPGIDDIFQIRAEAIPNPPVNANYVIGNRDKAIISDSVANITINYL